MSEPRDDDASEGEILSVHLGPSANCSSIGSHIDFLFLSATVSGAMLGALAVALTSRAAEPTAAPEPEPDPEPQPEPSPDREDER